QKIHILIIDKKATLNDGFRYIKEMIYNNMAMFMFELFNRVIKARIIPKGIKTDAILVDESKEELEKHFLFNSDVIGGLKFETGKRCVNNCLTQRVNEPFSIPRVHFDEFKINNEWNYDEFQELFDDDNNDTKNNWLIKADYPGCGKTTAVTNYKK